MDTNSGSSAVAGLKSLTLDREVITCKSCSAYTSTILEISRTSCLLNVKKWEKQWSKMMVFTKCLLKQLWSEVSVDGLVSYLASGQQLFTVVASLSCHSGRKWIHSCQKTSRVTQSSYWSALEPRQLLLWAFLVGVPVGCKVHTQSFVKTSVHLFCESIFLLSVLSMENSFVGDRYNMDWGNSVRDIVLEKIRSWPKYLVSYFFKIDLMLHI